MKVARAAAPKPVPAEKLISVDLRGLNPTVYVKPGAKPHLVSKTMDELKADAFKYGGGVPQLVLLK